MDDDQLARIIDRLRVTGSDDSSVEVKSARSELPGDVWPTVSAFANTDGGLIILGISEEAGFQPVSGFDPRRITDALASGLSSSSPKVAPLPPFTIESNLFQNRPVVVLTVGKLAPENSQIPGPVAVVGKKQRTGHYQRVADQNKLMTVYEIKVDTQRWRPVYVDEEVVSKATVGDLSPRAIDSLISYVERRGSRAFDGVTTDEDKLRRLRALADNGVTLAGLLTLGSYPQMYYPRLVIDVTEYPEHSKGAGGSILYRQSVTCDGSLPTMVADAIGAVESTLRTVRTRGEGGKVYDVPEIPADVLREAITNAVMHRSYEEEMVGAQVQVEVYPDRVEITNPGGLWQDRTVDNLDEGVSRSRNPSLTNLLRSTPRDDGSGPIAESLGSGIPRMKGELQKAGLPGPEYHATRTQVTVVLKRQGLVTPEVREWLTSLPGGPFSSSELSLLALAARPEGIRVAAARQILGLDSDEVRSLLWKLKDDGLVVSLLDGTYYASLTVAHFSKREQQVLAVLTGGETKNIQQLAQATGLEPTQLRPVLRGLVDAGDIIATAPPTSRNRAYRLADLTE